MLHNRSIPLFSYNLLLEKINGKRLLDLLSHYRGLADFSSWSSNGTNLMDTTYDVSNKYSLCGYSIVACESSFKNVSITHKPGKSI